MADAELDTLQSLVEKSLLRFTDCRYWMLETIREYAAERLEIAGEMTAYRRRHAVYFKAIAEEATTRQDAAYEERLDDLEPERDNFRAAVGWSRTEDVATALALVVDVSPLWVLRGPLEEGLRSLASALDEAPAHRSRHDTGGAGQAGGLCGSDDPNLRDRHAPAITRTG